jgi:hypothetical protein
MLLLHFVIEILSSITSKAIKCIDTLVFFEESQSRVL